LKYSEFEERGVHKKKVSVHNVEIREPMVTAKSFPAVGARVYCMVYAWAELYIIKIFGVQNTGGKK
jgi:hypothetical protein